MDRGEFYNRRIGSVKAAINMFGEKILEGNPTSKKQTPLVDLLERPNSRTRELHLARRDMGRYKEEKRVSESVKAQAESELHNAMNTKKELALLIQESDSEAKVQMQYIDKYYKKTRRRKEEWALTVGKTENYQYADVMRELEFVKQDLSKLKLDMASVLEEKKRAEKETEASSSKLWSYSSSADALRKEIEGVNEEQVVVELARIEALKEWGAIEAQKEKEASQFYTTKEQTCIKLKDIIQEIDRTKELETKLAVVTAEVSVLQNELKLAEEMDKEVERNETSTSLLESVTQELEIAKKELASVREEGFQFMASIDIIREELKHITEETARLKKTEEKADLTVQSLNSKLLRAMSKLEAASASEAKAKEIVSNLFLTLEQLKTEAEVAKKEKELIIEETATMKEEIQKNESEIDLAEEKLQTAMQELEAVKSSEAITLEKLKILTENTMRARASTSHNTNLINISKFEYEYLTGRAVEAEKIADKKVVAAQGWIEALKASEKEIMMKTEIAHRERRELMLKEEQEKPLSAKRGVNGELENWRQKREKNNECDNLQLARVLPRKSMNNGNLTPVRRVRIRKSASPGTRHMPRSSAFAVKKKKEVLPNLAKLFSSNKIQRDL